MAIMPKFKPGQLVKYSFGTTQLVGLVKSTRIARRRGDPVFILVQWSGKCLNNQEEYIPQNDLRLVEDTDQPI